jgi:hypothetical protein
VIFLHGNNDTPFATACNPCVYRKPKPGHSGDGVRRVWGTI